MTTHTDALKNLLGPTIFRHVKIDDTPVPPPDAHLTKGMTSAAALNAGALAGFASSTFASAFNLASQLATKSPSARAAKISKGSEVLQLYSFWLEREHQIRVRMDGEQVHIDHPYQYLLLRGLEDAIFDWHDGGYILDATRIPERSFALMHEYGGAAIELDDVTTVHRIEKPKGSWTSTSTVLQTLQHDKELEAELRARFATGHPWDRASLVALAHRSAIAESPQDRLATLLRGEPTPTERSAVDWVHSLHHQELTRLQRLLSAHLHMMHDAVDLIENTEANGETARFTWAQLAVHREVAAALLILLRDAGISVASLQNLVLTLDERAETAITVTPPIASLANDLLLQRSRALNAETWWAKLLP